MKCPNCTQPLVDPTPLSGAENMVRCRCCRVYLEVRKISPEQARAMWSHRPRPADMAKITLFMREVRDGALTPEQLAVKYGIPLRDTVDEGHWD